LGHSIIAVNITMSLFSFLYKVQSIFQLIVMKVYSTNYKYWQHLYGTDHPMRKSPFSNHRLPACNKNVYCLRNSSQNNKKLHSLSTAYSSNINHSTMQQLPSSVIKILYW